MLRYIAYFDTTLLSYNKAIPYTECLAGQQVEQSILDQGHDS